LLVIILVHWSIFKILGWVFTGYGAFTIIVLTYYFSIRSIVRFIAFPGALGLFKRNLEFSYCKSMAKEVLRSLLELKGCLEMYLSHTHNDIERTDLLHSGIHNIIVNHLYSKLKNDENDYFTRMSN
jgi:hypothetical protein